MKTMVGKIVSIVLVSILNMLASSCLCFSADTIRLGVPGPHSGDLASYGIPTVRAAEIVAKQINSQGGVLGKKVELLVEDDVCKPEIAVNVATKLISEDVDVVLGHACSGSTKAALNIYMSKNVIVMSPSSTSPLLTQSGKYPNFFRTIAADDAQARLEVEFAINRLKVRKIAILHDKGDYGKGIAGYAKTFIELAEDPSTKVVLFEGITPGAVDYSAVVQKIKRSNAEAIIFGGYHPEAAKIVIQMRKKRMDTIFISDDGVKEDTFIKVAGKYSEGVYATGPKDVATNPLTAHARKQHREIYKADPGPFFENAYAATLALLNAIEKAGSTEADDIAAALRNYVIDTPLGLIKFDNKGDAIGVGFSMYQVQNGAYVELK